MASIHQLDAKRSFFEIGVGQSAGRSLRLVYFLLVSVSLFALFNRWAYDDPFITYRYAQNLASGLGFVYNPGERVLSTTTPLFALLLSALGFVWPDLPRLANLVGAASLAAGGLLLWDLAGAWKSPLVGWAGLALYPTFHLAILTLGSETPLYLALCLAAFAAYARQRYPLAALAASLAVLARPDGALVAVLLAGDFLLKRRRPVPWRSLAIFGAVLLPWVVFAWLYFGSPLPATLAAKQHQGAMAISQRFASGFLTILGWYTSWPYLLEAALALLGVAFAFRRRAWLLFLAWPVIYFAAYAALGVSRYFWYYAPLVPGFVVAVGLGISALGGLAGSAKNQRSAISGQPSAAGRQSATAMGGAGTLLPVLLAAALLAALLFGQGRSLWRQRGVADERYAIYRAAGEWLRANTSPAEAVGALEVGILGYYARRPIVDFAGLIQPAVAARLAPATDFEAAALWAVDRYQPDFLVLHAGGFPNLEQGWVAANCSLAERFPGSRFDFANDLLVYDCRK
jgi:hypothetical protein